MNISVSHYTSKGGRKKNEDNLSVSSNQNGALAVVADGLGGHGDGEVASLVAVQRLIRELSNQEVTTDRMKIAMERVNNSVRWEQKMKNSDMKTTIAAVWLENGKAVISHVGDSRIYHFRDGKIIFQSLDHSVSQMAVKVGEISQNEIRGHVDRNKLLRALGMSQQTKTDITGREIFSGDAFLLCTDGFWELIDEREMEEDLKKSATVSEWILFMKQRVESRMKENADNHTAIGILLNE